MKKRIPQLLSLLMFLVLLLSFAPMTACPVAADEVDTWTSDANYYDTTWYTVDTTKTNYTVTTAAQLAGLAHLVAGDDAVDFNDKTITLGADVNLSAHLWTPIGTDKKPFKGTFDGGGHTISGMRCPSDHSYAGLFGYVDGYTETPATIRDVTVSGTITLTVDGGASFCAGGIVANASNTLLEGCVNRCMVAMKLSPNAYDSIFVGGVIGQAGSGTTALDCTNEGTVIILIAAPTSTEKEINATVYVGGVAGVGVNSLTSCRNTAAVAVTAESASTDPVTYAAGGSAIIYMGGIIGNSTYSMITDCANTGSVTNTGNGKLKTEVCMGGIGGIIGGNVYLYNSYNLGAVFGVKDNAADSKIYAGGIIGMFSSYYGELFYLDNCYSAAPSISSEKDDAMLGGIVACLRPGEYIEDCHVNNCYWLTDGAEKGVVSQEGDFDISFAACGTFADAEATLTAATGAQGFPTEQTISPNTTLLAALNAWVTAENIASPDSAYAPWYAPSGVVDTISPYPGFKKVHTLTFDTNGGSAIPAVSKTSGTTVDLTAYQPTKPDYDFDGWYSNPDLTTKVTSIKLAENTTVYAKWTAKSVPPEMPFVDVPADAYYYDAVIWAVENDIAEGTDPTTFSPDGFCTRSQAVTFLWRGNGSPAPTTTAMPFNDVLTDKYYYNAVLWAVEKGITKGTDATTFNPDGICTRAQAVTFLWRAEGSDKATTANPFTDVPSDAYYADAVLWAVDKKITVGTNATTFSPDDHCTRGQMITFLYRDMH